MNNFKFLIITFFIFLFFVSNLFLNNIQINKYPKLNFYNLLYNENLYLSNFSFEQKEYLISDLRAKIISNLDQLVFIKHRFSYLETLSSLAKKYGTNIDSIRSSNNIEAISLVYPGKILLITNKKGMLYQIKKNDENVFSLSKKFKKSIEDICRINSITPFYRFKKGDYVFIPDKYIKFKDFMLPLFNTKISSDYGLRKHPLFGILKHHEGLDLKQKFGAPVRAACDGKVIFAGWAEGYGNLIIIQHHKGYTTYYGHLSKIKVKFGQHVYKGQIIGNVGSTGWTTGPHLHFEVRKDGIPVNPKKVLF